MKQDYPLFKRVQLGTVIIYQHLERSLIKKARKILKSAITKGWQENKGNCFFFDAAVGSVQIVVQT